MKKKGCSEVETIMAIPQAKRSGDIVEFWMAEAHLCQIEGASRAMLISSRRLGLGSCSL
jgi:hypothetical protein